MKLSTNCRTTRASTISTWCFRGLRHWARGACQLHSCRKIKMRRLFFVFADRHKHAWRERLNADEFDLGTGDRALVKGGRIHPRYRIMVPPEFIPGSGETDGP